MKKRANKSFIRRVALVLLLVTSASAWAGSWSDTFYATDVKYAFQEWSYMPILKGGTKLTAHRGQYDSPDGGPTKMYISNGEKRYPLVAEVLEGYGITSVVLQTANTYAGTLNNKLRAYNGSDYYFDDYYIESSGPNPGSTITVYFTNVTSRVEIHLVLNDFEASAGLELTSVTVNYRNPIYTVCYATIRETWEGSKIDTIYRWTQTKAHGINMPLRGAPGYFQLHRDYYTHDGWAWGPTAPKAYDFYGTYWFDNNATLYPHWTPIDYNITYDLDGGTLDTPNPTTYNVESEAITLNNPTREGSAFVGWNYNGNNPATIWAGSYGDRHYKAIWWREKLELANDGDNSSAIDAVLPSGLHSDVTLTDRTLYRDGDWNTLCLPFGVNNFADTPLEGATVKTLESSAFDEDEGTLTMNFSGDLTSIEAGKPYIVKYTPVIIRSAADWNTFASNVNNGTDNYKGRIVKLAADIPSVSTMVGNATYPFRGIFDGCGHTLNVSITANNRQAAPFLYINNATIVNLVTAGSVTLTGQGGGDNSSGLAGFAANSTIKNCRISVAVKKNSFKPFTHLGGLVGSATGTLTITDCLFDGQMLDVIGTGVYHGGFVGEGTASITNSLFAPASVTVRTEEGGTFSQGGGTFTNCYYTQTLGDDQDTNNASGMTGDELLTALGDGWEISGDQVVPKMEVNLDIHNPVFIDFPVSTATANVETQYVDFVGNCSPVDIASEDRSIVYLGAEGSLYYPNAAMQIGSCRAYFQLKGLSADDKASEVRAFRLNFGDDATTGVIAMDNGQWAIDNEAGAWYSMDGRRLDGKPTARGFYVNNGRKVFVK